MLVPTLYLLFWFFELDLADELTLRFSRGFFAWLASLNEASSTWVFEVCCLIGDLVGFFLNEESIEIKDEYKFGWSSYSEITNGRFAMIGFLAIILIELFSKQSFLKWAGIL